MMTVTNYTDNQFANHVDPKSKHFFIRIFLNAEQQAKLTEAVARKKAYIAKLEANTGRRLEKASTTGVLFEAFLHMSNECLDKLLNDVITRINEDIEALSQ